MKRKLLFLLMAVPMLTWGQNPVGLRLASGARYYDGYLAEATASSSSHDNEDAKSELDSCHVHEVKSLPGSHQFGSNFIEAMAGDPDPRARDRGAVWGLTADLSSKVPAQDRVMYISKSNDGGKTWTQVARVDSRYFNADIAEGERNGLSVFPGGSEFVITTQKGAFQVLPQSGTSNTVVRSIDGLRVSQPDPMMIIPKREGDPVTANVVKITPDGKHLIVGYGYFDLNPQILIYRRGRDGSWIKDGRLPPLPTDMDILSMQFGDRRNAGALYVGTGDQAFELKARAKQWIRIDGVGDDSAVQGISTVGGPHLAACWGVYNPVSADAVQRVTHANFLLHRNEDEAGPNIRAFTIEVDPSRPNREMVTSLTGVYFSKDGGEQWQRLNDVPDGEFRSAYFNADGTVIVSGIFGTFLANPFSAQCSAHLRTRNP
jgi:hypothetical protein